MAYGKGRSKETTERRAIEIGRVRLPHDAPHPLSEIRDGVRALCEEMAIAAWVADPTAKPLDGKALDKALLPLQKASDLNSVWAENARMIVRAAVPEQHGRRGRHLFGVLLHLDKTKTDERTGETVFVNVPAALAEDPDRLCAFARRMEALPDAERMALAGRVFREEKTDLDDFGVAVIRAALARSCERFSRPSWALRAADGVVRLSLDPRSVLGGKAVGTLPERLASLTAAMRAGTPQSGVLTLSGPKARTGSIPLPFRLAPSAHLRHGDAEASAFCVEIGPKAAVVKLVLAKTRPKLPDLVRFVIGRDFGYRNTVALCLIDLGKRMPLAAARALVAEISTKTEARAHLSKNVAPDRARVLETRLFSGAGFMRVLEEIGDNIDKLRSEIDRGYARLANLKREFLAGTGQPPDAAVPDLCPEDVGKLARKHHARWRKLFDRLGGLKEKRRALYRRADGVKRSWFGHIANIEIEMAARHGAAVISEDLTVEAVDRDSPQYKGRAMNRLFNNGARGRYARAADDKAAWAGVPTLRVHSAYTSSTDVRNGVVDKTQRKRDVFTARADGATAHADLNAALTIGLWPFLTPRAKEMIVRKRLLPVQAGLAG